MSPYPIISLKAGEVGKVACRFSAISGGPEALTTTGKPFGGRVRGKGTAAKHMCPERGSAI